MENKEGKQQPKMWPGVVFLVCVAVLIGTCTSKACKGEKKVEKTPVGQIKTSGTVEERALSCAQTGSIVKLNDVSVQVTDDFVLVTAMTGGNSAEQMMQRSCQYGLEVAHKIYEVCPELNRVGFFLQEVYKDQDGKEFKAKSLGFDLNRVKLAGVAYESMRAKVIKDYKEILTVAENVDIHPAVRQELGL